MPRPLSYVPSALADAPRLPHGVPLPRRQALAWLAASGALLLSAGCDPFVPPGAGSTAPFKGIDTTGAEYAGGFQLTDAQGRPRSLTDFKGRVVMLYFGFVQCPDVCPTAFDPSFLALTGSAEQIAQTADEYTADVRALLAEAAA